MRKDTPPSVWSAKADRLLRNRPNGWWGILQICKPGSVPPLLRFAKQTAGVMIIYLALPLLARSSAVYPGIVTSRACSILPLFNLAPRGDCSFHPRLAARLVSVALILPDARTHRTVGVTHHAALWSPDFPPPL